MKVNIKKLVLTNIPYIFMGIYASKLPQAFRLADGQDFASKIRGIGGGFSLAFESMLPSFYPSDFVLGLAIGGMLKLIVYSKGKNAKKYRQGVEYGSARWGNAKDIEPFRDVIPEKNVILTQTEGLMMNPRPSEPKNARNKNVLIIGGSGSGKTRFWLKPNLMQMHSSYVITDPKGLLY